MRSIESDRIRTAEIEAAVRIGVQAALEALSPSPAPLVRAPPASVPKLAYSLVEAAEQLTLHPRTVRTLVNTGELPAFKPSGLNRVLIKHADLVAYIERQPPRVPPLLRTTED